MDTELDLLLRTAIDSLVKLELLIYFHSRPGSVHSPADIGKRLRRPTHEVAQALEELSHLDLVARFALGTGRHVMYGPSDDAHVQSLLGLLQERYTRDSSSRAEIVHKVLHGRENDDANTSFPAP
jgi:hypothetical protein